MSPRTVKLLHIEDDEAQRLLMAHHLATMPDFAFAVTYAESEDEALDRFGHDGAELVIVDYHLTAGNGLSTLKRLRQADPIVPIVAVSGAATPEIAAELLSAGADDYLSKKDLVSETLAQSLRAALARADAWKQRAGGAKSDRAARVQALFNQLGRTFAARFDAEVQQRLEQFDQAARQARLSPAQLQQLLEQLTRDLDATPGLSGWPARQRLRPLLLEICMRLFGQPVETAAPPASKQ